MRAHPSPTHPTDEDLSVGTPGARWMGHSVFIICRDWAELHTFGAVPCVYST